MRERREGLRRAIGMLSTIEAHHLLLAGGPSPPVAHEGGLDQLSTLGLQHAGAGEQGQPAERAGGSIEGAKTKREQWLSAAAAATWTEDDVAKSSIRPEAAPAPGAADRKQAHAGAAWASGATFKAPPHVNYNYQQFGPLR